MLFRRRGARCSRRFFLLSPFKFPLRFFMTNIKLLLYREYLMFVAITQVYVIIKLNFNFDLNKKKCRPKTHVCDLTYVL